MSETGGAPPPQKGRAHPSFRRAAYVVLYVAAIMIALGAGVINIPKWPTIIMIVVILFAGTWALEFTSLNPDRDRDPFGRKFPTIVRHWLRARSLRSKPVDWHKANQQGLPSTVVETLRKHAGNDPEVTASVDGLLWVIAECDDWDNLEPPVFALMAFDPAGQMQAQDDFIRWPKGWTGPAGSSVGRKIRWVVRTR